MNRFDRVSLTTRAFCLAAILGLTLAVFDMQALRGTVLLIAISAASLALGFGSWPPRSWVLVAEGALAALIVGVSLPEGVVLLPYLVVPSLLAGLVTGVRAVLTVVGLEAAAVVVVVLTAGGEIGFGVLSSSLVPWIITSLGVGLLCSWLRELRIGTGGFPRDPSYETARRLLTQLRTVARRLSSGLDLVTISSQLLTTTQQHFRDSHAGLFLRTETGQLSPIGYRDLENQHILPPDDALIAKVARTGRALQQPQPSGMASRRNRVVVPLMSEDRLIGILVTETATRLHDSAVEALQTDLEVLALRLDAALAFDEIRALATMEERQRLAREIHDGIAQEISALGYAVDDLIYTAVSDQQSRKLTALRAELTRVVSELRLSIFDLRSEASAGLGSALSDYVRQVGERSGMTVHLTLDQAPTRLRPEIEAEMLRIAQEAITNARKHSGAENLWVDCRIRPPHARIVITDDGKGLGRARPDSYGLGIMRERAARINADLQIDGADHDGGRGTSVVVRIGPETPTPTSSLATKALT